MSTINDHAASPETDGSATPPGAVRASNAEREETVARLHEALTEGRLDLDETEQRIAAAYAARYRSELPPLLADLPQPPPPPGEPISWDRIRASAGIRARAARDVAREIARWVRGSRRRLVVALLAGLLLLFGIGAAGADLFEPDHDGGPGYHHHGEDAPVRPGAGDAPIQPGQAPIQPGQAPIQPGQAPIQPGPPQPAAGPVPGV